MEKEEKEEEGQNEGGEQRLIRTQPFEEILIYLLVINIRNSYPEFCSTLHGGIFNNATKNILICQQIENLFHENSISLSVTIARTFIKHTLRHYFTIQEHKFSNYDFCVVSENVMYTYKLNSPRYELYLFYYY